MAQKTKTSKQQTATKTLTKASVSFEVRHFQKLVNELPWHFPDKDLGKHIQNFMPTCKVNAHRLNLDGNIDLTKIDTLADYIVALNSNKWFTTDIAESVIDGARFWVEKRSKYSFMEIILIQLASISKLGCVVLYKKDMCPRIDTDIRMTTITTGQYITPHCVKKRG